MYDYEDHKAWLFSDEGQRAFLKLRDWVKALFSQHQVYMGPQA